MATDTTKIIREITAVLERNQERIKLNLCEQGARQYSYIDSFEERLNTRLKDLDLKIGRLAHKVRTQEFNRDYDAENSIKYFKTFGYAMEAVMAGAEVHRKEWEDVPEIDEAYIHLLTKDSDPDSKDQMAAIKIFSMMKKMGSVHTDQAWSATQSDMLAQDWVVFFK